MESEKDAQWKEKEVGEKEGSRKSKTEHPTDFPSSQVQIRAYCASSLVSWGCERERKSSESGGRGRMVERETKSNNFCCGFYFLLENYVGFGYFQPRLYPTDPYLGIFFWKKSDIPGVGMQQYPDCTHTLAVPGMGTVPKLPYPCFIDNNKHSNCSTYALTSKRSLWYSLLVRLGWRVKDQGSYSSTTCTILHWFFY